ncbi:MAG: GntG family PLP-dependent aldolase [Phycisphaerae bacterium]
MPRIAVDLYSDTLTQPTPGMRQAIAAAEVGDEQKREDPTVNRLQEMTAELTGHAAGLFLPSGTMCNLIAHMIHCRSGDEIIIEENSHPVHFEGGGPAVLAGASIRGLKTARGLFSAEQVEQALRPNDPHFPRSRLVCVENTHNMGGGCVWPMAALREVTAMARRHGLMLHLDGARLMNAVVAGGYSARDCCTLFDSAWLDLTKGLGCPVGAVLVGGQEFIDHARRCKQLLGGAMRQAGMIAAAGVYALTHHVQRLAEDHAHARRLATGLAEIRGIAIDPAAVETNIVMFDIAATGIDKPEFLRRLESQSVRMSSAIGATRVRAVTHLDVPTAGIDRALAAVRTAVGAA